MFLLTLTISSGFIELGLSPGPSVKPELTSVQDEDLSIQWGDNIFENLPYTYSGTFYETTDYSYAFQTAEIQFQYVDDTSIDYEYTITDSLVNSETQFPLNSSFTMVNGTHYQNGTLTTVDNDYAIFNSTAVESVFLNNDLNITEIENQDKRIERNNIRSFLNYTIPGNFADMQNIDGDYATFESEETGHYPATYSFTNETGLEDLDISFNSYLDSIDEAIVIDSYLEHSEVLRLYDAATGSLYHYFDDTSVGTIEFWVDLMSGASVEVYLIEDGVGYATDSRIYPETTRNYKGDGVGGSEYVNYAVPEGWIYFRIEWDCVADTFDLFINEHQLFDDVNFLVDNDLTFINSFRFKINSAGSYGVLDGFGESWDPDYDALGDNSYWDYYNDISSDFESEDTDTSSTSIGFVDTDTSDADCGAIITPDFSEHKKVMELYDENGAGRYEIFSDFSSGQTSGTVEWWVKSSDATHSQIMILKGEGSQNAVQLYLRVEKHQYYSGSSMHDTGLAALDDTWYRYKIVFDCGTNTYDIWIDDVLYQTGVAFQNNAVTLDFFYFQGDTGASGYSMYIDAVGYDWDANYDVGDNKLPNDPRDLEFNVDLNLDSLSSLDNINLIYSYNTSIIQTCNFSVYNFDNLNYDSIEYASRKVFTVNTFALNSSYYNATNDLILKFKMSNNSFTEFEFRLEMLKIRHTSFLNFTTYVFFETFINWLQLDIESYQMSNISQLIDLSAWNYTSNSWDVLDSESFTSSFQLSDYSNDINPSDYVNDDGRVLLSYYGVNNTNDFEFYLDKLELSIFHKTVLNYEKTLQLLGTWKYRFKLDEGLGSEWIDDWIYFDVVPQAPNFEGISESRYSTRWVLTSTDTSGTLGLVYEDDLTSGSWFLTDYSSNKFRTTLKASEDSYVTNEFPTTNYGSETHLDVEYRYTWVPDKQMRTYVEFDYSSIPYFDETQSGVDATYYYSYIYSTNYGYGGEKVIYLYKTGDFSEGIITYNTQPTQGIELAWEWVYWSGYPYWKYWGFTADYRPEDIVVRYNGGTWDRSVNFYSTEYSSSYCPYLSLSITKGYHNTGSGYAYMQTDSTETLGLISQQLSSDVSLNEGDIFTIDLQTTSSNALLKLYNGGVLQSTLNLLTANTETARQEVEVYVSEDVSFDQVKITSELDDTEYLKLYDIKAEHWTFEVGQESDSMYVEPFGQNELIINNLGNVSLKIYENDILQTDTYITISYNLLTLVFESPLPLTVFVSFYDSNNEYLDFNRFETYVNYTLYEENFINQRLTSREFYVDESSTIYFNIYDSFDVMVYSASRLAKTFIDITLNVYALKIKNEAEEYASYSLKNNATAITKEGLLFPQEIVEFSIALGTYIIDYINYEDEIPRQLSFSFSDNKLIVINTTYFYVYFSIFNYDGLGLNKDLVRFYVNNLRKDFGFNTLKQDTNNLKVLDYFNATLFNQDLNLRHYTEYNILVEVYALIINNNYTHSIRIEIERNNIAFSQVIPAQYGMPYRFLPNMTYKVRSYYINDTLIEEREIKLDKNNKIASFGFYSEEIPIIPDFNAPNTWLMIILILLGCGFAIAFIGYIAYRYRKKSENYRRSYAEKITLEAQTIKKFSQGRRIR